MARWRGRSGPNGRPRAFIRAAFPPGGVRAGGGPGGRALTQAGPRPCMPAGTQERHGARATPKAAPRRCPCRCGGRVSVPPGRPRSQAGQPGQTCPKRLGFSGAQLSSLPHPLPCCPPRSSFRIHPFPRRAGDGGKGGNGGLSQPCLWSRKTGPGHLPGPGVPQPSQLPGPPQRVSSGNQALKIQISEPQFLWRWRPQALPPPQLCTQTLCLKGPSVNPQPSPLWPLPSSTSTHWWCSRKLGAPGVCEASTGVRMGLGDRWAGESRPHRFGDLFRLEASRRIKLMKAPRVSSLQWERCLK